MRHLAFVLLFATACGHQAREQTDARAVDSAMLPADAPADTASTDAADVPCTFVASTGASPLLAFTFAGGTFASYGCAPIDPTYWLAGAGMSVTVTFSQPQQHPSLRVWGMNTDDTASVMVNGAPYALDSSSASLAPKVVCGLSPGPDGVTFVAGTLAGANTPGDGNYSYQDVKLNAASVTSVQLTGLTGAGWGFVGASVGCGDVIE